MYVTRGVAIPPYSSVSPCLPTPLFPPPPSSLTSLLVLVPRLSKSSEEKERERSLIRGFYFRGQPSIENQVFQFRYLEVLTLDKTSILFNTFSLRKISHLILWGGILAILYEWWSTAIAKVQWDNVFMQQYWCILKNKIKKREKREAFLWHPWLKFTELHLRYSKGICDGWVFACLNLINGYGGKVRTRAKRK